MDFAVPYSILRVTKMIYRLIKVIIAWKSKNYQRTAEMGYFKS